MPFRILMLVSWKEKFAITVAIPKRNSMTPPQYSPK
jgi:hypothetical protein